MISTTLGNTVTADERLLTVVSKVESKTGRAAKKTARGFQVYCPSGDDGKNADCHIYLGDNGSIIIGCYSCGRTFEELRDLIGLPSAIYQSPDKWNGSRGHVETAVTEARNRGELKKKRPETTYHTERGFSIEDGFHYVEEFPYRNADGDTAYTELRIENTDGDKKVLPYHTVGNRWVMGRGGERLLYGLDLLASTTDQTVCITEGARKSNYLWDMGLLATTDGGAKVEWDTNNNKYFFGKDVLLFPDNDEVGQKKMQAIANALKDVAKSIKIVQLPNLEESGDIVDWVKVGGTKEGLLEIIESTPILSEDTKSLDKTESVTETDKDLMPLLSARDILLTEFKEPVWAIPNLLPTGLTILAGAPKMGKSWLALQIALAVSSGGNVLGTKVEKGRVLYLALEDSPRRLKDRLTKQGWTTDLETDFLTLGRYDELIGDLTKGGAQKLAKWIDNGGYRLVVIDTLSRAIKGDQNKVEEMTRGLTPLQEMAHAKNCAVVVIDHHKKGSNGESSDAIADILGSTAKGAMVDTSWGLYRARGKTEAKLAITGRDIEEQTLSLKVDWSTGVWQNFGDAEAVSLSGRRKQTLCSITELGESATIQRVAKHLDKDQSNIGKDMRLMRDDGLLDVEDNGGRAVYFLTEKGKEVLYSTN